MQISNQKAVRVYGVCLNAFQVRVLETGDSTGLAASRPDPGLRRDSFGNLPFPGQVDAGMLSGLRP